MVTLTGNTTPPLPANIQAAIRAREVPSISEAARRALNARRKKQKDGTKTAPVIKNFSYNVPYKETHGGKHRKGSQCKTHRSRSKKMRRKTRRRCCR